MENRASVAEINLGSSKEYFPYIFTCVFSSSLAGLYASKKLQKIPFASIPVFISSYYISKLLSSHLAVGKYEKFAKYEYDRTISMSYLLDKTK